jgi:hypothetical protein
MLLDVEVLTQRPIAARFEQRKQAIKKECVEIMHDALQVKKSQMLLGDSGLDIVELSEQLMDDGVMPVISYNPRNLDELLPVKYKFYGDVY